jgi:hypothetical protein
VLTQTLCLSYVDAVELVEGSLHAVLAGGAVMPPTASSTLRAAVGVVVSEDDSA